MVLRTFVDSTGAEWEAFDVVPRDTERRMTDRRASSSAKSGRDVERRERDRRLSVGGRSRLTGQGWLAFQHGEDRRRLSPIPADWHRVSDVELEAYCLKARPVRASVAGDAQAARRRR